MTFSKKVAVAINLDRDIPPILKSLKDLVFLRECEIHLVHIFPTSSYAFGLGLSESTLILPIEEDRMKMVKSSLAALKEYSDSVFDSSFKGKIHLDSFFSDDPKRKFCGFIEENNIDLVITAAREKRGYFESSFTEYINKHSQANLLILKHKP